MQHARKHAALGNRVRAWVWVQLSRRCPRYALAAALAAPSPPRLPPLVTRFKKWEAVVSVCSMHAKHAALGNRVRARVRFYRV